jgi:type I restriction enzyme R subunit
MGALDAHTLMSTQALNSPADLHRLSDILLNHSHLYEALRARASSSSVRA